MPVRTFNPTSPGQRFQTVQTFDEITTSTPLFMGGFRPERRRRLAAAA